MKKSITLALTLPALALLASCGGNKADVDTNTTVAADNSTVTDITTDTDNGTMNATVPTPAMSGQEFANTVGASDAFEIASGKLAQQKATTDGLKDFGKMIVEDHTKSTGNLKTAAGKANPKITPDPTMTAEQKANLATLQSATGADFDAAFKTQQVAAHQKALAALQGYAASGTVNELKDFASSTSSVVQSHLEKIQGM